MEVRVEHKSMAVCHPEDLWQIFRTVDDWRNWTGIFGQSGWVHGAPWQPGSRFFIEVIAPRRVDLEVVVLRCSAPREVVLLCHGEGLAAELWIHFTPDDWDRSNVSIEAAVVGTSKLPAEGLKTLISQIFQGWFDGLSVEAEKHCTTIAL
ncbi:MAG TPA: hypothetical protein VMZ25_02870 [Terriglobales bacterium]|nr:hypothetical protein [Terriglobales bacterium]